jgi:ribosomal protein S18 acetylase RimI-like enzyme
VTDADLYRRGVDTLLASWKAYARGARDAALIRAPGVAAAVFPHDPERGVYNNAVVERDLAASERAAALEAAAAAYAAAGVERFALWVHETDEAMREDVERRGYLLDTTTRAMGMTLNGIAPARPQLDLAAPAWSDYLRTFGLPAGLLRDADRSVFNLVVARVDGDMVATAMTFDHGTDCGIYNVGTVEHARRRGFGAAVTALHLYDAVARGCETATLQATPMAERMYAGVGFRDLGQFLEYVPPVRPR